MSGIEIRSMITDDVPGVIDLFKNVFKREISSEMFNWQYVSNPYLTKPYEFNLLAVTPDGIIVGHSAFLPGDYRVGDRIIRAALSATSMVDPNFPGLFPTLYSKLEGRMEADNYDLLYAFPNENSFPFFLKFFQYTESHFSLFQIETNLLVSIDSESSYKIDSSSVSNALNSEYIQWRLDHSPYFQYSKIAIEGVNFYYKTHLSNQIDLVAIEPCDVELKTRHIVLFVQSIPSETYINLYSTSPRFTALLNAFGFSEAISRNRFIYKWLGEAPRSNNFFLQMIDSDVF
jgi:hypothetical protein